MKPTDSQLIVMSCGVSIVVAFCIVATTAEVVFGGGNPVKTIDAQSSDEKRSSIDEGHPLYVVLEAARKSKKQIDDIEDYECTFSKHELVGKKMIKSTMTMKFREQTFSVYLHYLDFNPGREVIYVQGKNNDNLLVHDAGIKAMLGTHKLSPKAPVVMAENRHPITSIGLKNMLDTVIKQWESEGDDGEVITQLKPALTSPAGDKCTVCEAIHPKSSKDIKYHITRLWIEDESGLAIGVQQLGFPAKNEKEPPVIEQYFYSKLKLNVKLSDADFDTKNPKYAF